MMIENSISAYANRRLNFALGPVLRGGSPYNTEIDKFKEECDKSGKEFISFAHYDYIGIADYHFIAERSIAAIRDLGFGAGASRLVGGERTIHRALEAALARFIGTEDSLVLVSGFGTNASLIGHLLGANDLIVYDDLCHSSMLAGVGVTRAATITFKHNNLDDLERVLTEQRKNHKRTLIICEGLYSMDGDCVDLARVVALKRRFNAWLYIDEAHSIGVMGDTGRGAAEHFGIDRREIDITMGTLSKTFGTCGGFIGASKPVIEWLRHTLPGYVYSVGMPPSVAAASLAAVEVLESEPERVAQLQENARYFLNGARNRGLRTGLAGGFAIVPVHFTRRELAIGAYEHLLANGIYAPPIVQLAVPKDLPRLRMFVSAAHTVRQMDKALDLLAAYGKEHDDLVAPMEPFDQGARKETVVPLKAGTARPVHPAAI